MLSRGPLRITGVDPMIARAGDLVIASGNGLDRSNINALYLTDGARTVRAAVLEQTATAIKFQVPEEAASGIWKEGERRLFEWNIVLQTSNGDLLNYTAFGIATE